MGWRVRRTIRIGKNYRINLSKSGMSASTKLGPVTVNSRRGATVHVAKGVSYYMDQGATHAAPQQRISTTSRGCCLFTTFKWLVIAIVGLVVIAVIASAR